MVIKLIFSILNGKKRKYVEINGIIIFIIIINN